MVHGFVWGVLTLGVLLAMGAQALEPSEVTPDLVTPPVSEGEPAPGKRVRQVNEEYAGTDVYHALYLPIDWRKGKKYPVIVEYAGNRNADCLGTVDCSNLGYGISAGKGVIWICLPYVDPVKRRNALTWWGDVDATVDYCLRAVSRICREYGGDPAAVLLAGFSRGSVACNYIGLHDDRIAGLWRGFICHSHYDGVVAWDYPGSDRASATARLARLRGRPQWVSHEVTTNRGVSLEATRRFLQEACPAGNFTFHELPFTQHTDAWVLRPSPERDALRAWVRKALQPKT